MKKLFLCLITLILISLTLELTNSANGLNQGKEGDYEKDTSIRLNNKSYIDSLRQNDSIKTKEINGKEIIKEYKILDKKVKISNSKETLLELKLTSEYNQFVGIGNDTKVAEFYVLNYNADNLFDLISSYDVNDKYNLVSKNYWFKYGIDYFEEECHNLKDYEPGLEEDKIICENVTKTHWTQFDKLKELPFKSIKVGLFTNTEEGEYVEWIPKINGLDILEWGSYQVIPVGTYTDSSSLSNVFDVAVSGDYAYTVAYGTSTLAVWDISAHGNPVPVGSAIGDSNLYSVAVSGDYAYTVSDAATLAVWDISAHGNPVPVGTYNDLFGPYSLHTVYHLAVSGDYAYTVAAGTSTLAVWDISAHGNPVPVGTYLDDFSLNYVFDVAVSGDYAYTVAFGTSTLAVWDISAHGNPVPVGTYTDSEGDYSLNSASGVAASGDYAYTVAYGTNTLAVWDISAHGNPVPVGTYTDSEGDYSLNSASSVEVSGNYVYTLSFGSATLAVWDISAHGNPVPVGTYTDSEGDYSLDVPRNLAVLGDYVYVVSSNDDTFSIFHAYSEGGLEDTLPPTWSLNSTNSTIAGTSVLHSVKWEDETALSGYIFSFDNGDGTLVNDSFVSMTGTSNWSNVTKLINSTIGSTIRWQVFANDSSNNWNQTDIFTYVTISAITSSCIYSGSGNWIIESTDFCNITSSVISPNFNNILIFNGTGQTTLTANISNFSIYRLQNEATVQCASGGCIRY